MRRILLPLIGALLCGMMLSACSEKDPEYIPRELTETERQKAHLDESFSAFITSLGVSSGEELEAFVRNFGYAEPTVGGGLHLFLRKDGTSYMDIYLIPEEDGLAIDISLMGGLSIHGIMRAPDARESSGWTIPDEFSFSLSELRQWWDGIAKASAATLDSLSGLSLYDNGTYAARIGFAAMHDKGAGKDLWTIVPVLRFEDGTSYTLDSLLLTGEIITMFISGL